METLFVTKQLTALLSEQGAKLHTELNSWNENRVLNTAIDDLVEYLVDKYQLTPINLHQERVSTGRREVEVTERNYFGEFHRVRKTEFLFFLPFDGHKNLLYCQPSRFYTNPPKAEIKEDELIFNYSSAPYTNLETIADKIKKAWEDDLAMLIEYITDIKNAVEQFNESLRPQARRLLEKRKEKFLQERQITAAIGLPLRNRPDAPLTYTLPEVRKKVPTLPNISSAPYQPEPTISDEIYENILSIIRNMTSVIERSPKAFSKMNEEDLRQHFLVQLNAQYEGQATGETFNFNGKTDILIRSNNTNVFIAECKFWRGAKSFTDTITQIIDYVTWRDTKTAIILFNRNQDISKVLAQIPELYKTHPNFKREMKLRNHREGEFRFVASHKNDSSREIIITVMVFDTPSTDKA